MLDEIGPGSPQKGPSPLTLYVQMSTINTFQLCNLPLVEVLICHTSFLPQN